MRQLLQQPGDDIMKVTVTQGQIIINTVWLTHESDELICFEADCKSKYPEYEGGGNQDLFFGAREHSLNVDHEAQFTKVEFDLPEIEAGWTALVETGRYYIHIV